MRLLAAALLLSSAALAAEPLVIPLYPGPAPGSESWTQQQVETIGPDDTVRRIRNVTKPLLFAYLPEKALANGTAVVICPGGGFRHLAIDVEGHDVARYLNSIGVAAFVLQYRLMPSGDAAENDAAVKAERRKQIIPMATADGRQALSIVRARAAEFGVAPDRIGIMGFSAGGYVAAAVALQHDAASRPNFAAPIYGAMPDDVTPPADAGPLFIAHADDDKTVNPVNTSIRMYTAWKKAGLSAEMHIYAEGGHGFGMRRKEMEVGTWNERFRDWLGVQKLLKPAAK
jgi:acetyl esterase/lipase